MFFTLFYMYATVLQWWRLSSLKNKLRGTLHPQNALLVCSENVIYESKKSRSFENLLFRYDDRVGCTVVPKEYKKINLSHWLIFPKDYRYFPIHFNSVTPRIDSPNIYVLIQAMLETYIKHPANILEVEYFGELVAWRAADTFEAILKTDIDKLTKLVHCFSQSDVDINHELKLLRIETIDVEGTVTRIKYERKFSLEGLRKYSHAPIHWKKFSDDIKEIYSKIRETTTPKITIENGAPKPEDVRKVPVSEVKPIKKDGKKHDDRNTLEVGANDYRRHKSNDHKRDKLASKTETSRSSKEDHKHKESPKTTKDHSDVKKTKDSLKSKDLHVKKDDKTRECHSKTRENHHKKDPSRLEKTKSKTDLEQATRGKAENGDGPSSNGHIHQSTEFTFTKYKGVKPPNILVYADSLIAKENVKNVLSTMLNKEKYIVYDLPTNPHQTMWDDSTVLVVVCGTVPPNLTFHLLQYLTTGGQLLCLCSDLLYSVLDTFTTAEVREHELVRFTYGKWKQVEMMHHIFCYQASPAKKAVFQRLRPIESKVISIVSNGSSPIAPRTPSTAEIQHNGKEYTIQVQVLGTEETWQTPSLLLASVKGGEGRVVFSQVHLEINPSQYEDDETKFVALKVSDQARKEILKDILSKHLDIECVSAEPITYTPAFFLGRHDLKLKLLSECNSIKDNLLQYDTLSVKFCGKDETADPSSSSFLPIFIHSCPSNFSTVNYFEALETEHIGRLVIYSDILTSSQVVISKPLCHGLAVIPRQQTQAVGRSNNSWISPIGSANFSLQLHIPRESPLGKVISFAQHMVMVAVVHAIKKMKGCQDINIGIKWPNDLYVNGNIKIGGLLANSTVDGDLIVLNVGCGINLDNPNPTLSINDLIRNTNLEKDTSIKTIGYETYFAAVFNEIEALLREVQSGNMDHIYDLYYKYWLHNDSDVVVTSRTGEKKRVRIIGIDDFGFLKVRADDGAISTVQPDGNSFDILRGLVIPKSF
ncbi:hypothetical protein NQ317_005081 [Molorchus minor]|uniref:BPL/LPL catalytic domain-containing protein n=1 Tax=Molorchus minor TaxID=1323400 RepID=A0ABQ9JX15_9CUCU|nr:hypothetical protein NQ317_005081 [Molorchus minor]